MTTHDHSPPGYQERFIEDLHKDRDRRQHHENCSSAVKEEAIREAFLRLGVDINSVDDTKELAADLYFLRRTRHGQQNRVTMTWMTAISAIVSALVGAGSVVLSNILHTGKSVP